MDGVSKKQAEIAAAWWAERISSPSPKNHDNGDHTLNGALCMSLGLMLAEKNRPTAEQVAKFRERLAEILVNGGSYTIPGYERTTIHLDGGTEKEFIPAKTVDMYPRLGLWTDYAPGIILCAAAEYAGIGPSVFPIKTGMQFEENDRVTASLGYGADWVEVEEKLP